MWQSHVVKEPVGSQDCCEFLLKQSIVTTKYTIGGSNIIPRGLSVTHPRISEFIKLPMRINETAKGVAIHILSNTHLIDNLVL